MMRPCACWWSRTTTASPSRSSRDCGARASSRARRRPAGRRWRRPSRTWCCSTCGCPTSTATRGRRDARALPGPDHHGHRQGRGGRPRDRPRAGRRRLRGQAVRAPRADRPHPRGHAPRRAAPREPDPVTPSAALEIDRRRRAVRRSTATSCADAEGVRPARGARGRPGPRWSGDDPRGGRGTRWYGPSKTIDVHVSSLRRKLGDPGWIETVRGVGFRLRSTMTRRLVATYLLLALVVLVALEVPLGIVNGRNQRRDLQVRVERDAVALAGLVEDRLHTGVAPGDPAAHGILDRYAADTDARVVVVGAGAGCSPTPTPPASSGRDFSSAPGDRAPPSAAACHGHAPLGDPRRRPCSTSPCRSPRAAGCSARCAPASPRPGSTRW